MDCLRKYADLTKRTPSIQVSKLGDHPVLVRRKRDLVDRDVDFTADLQNLECIRIRDPSPKMDGLQGRSKMEAFDLTIVVWNH